MFSEIFLLYILYHLNIRDYAAQYSGMNIFLQWCVLVLLPLI